MDGEQLIMIIAKNKETNKEEAKKAFALFCGYYEEEATKMSIYDKVLEPVNVIKRKGYKIYFDYNLQLKRDPSLCCSKE